MGAGSVPLGAFRLGRLSHMAAAPDPASTPLPAPAAPPAPPLVVQHNALVNARFDLNTTESRLFLAMLGRVQRDDVAFARCQVSVRELLGQSASHNTYELVRRMLKEFASRTLLIEKVGPDGWPLKKPSFIVIPLLAYAEYRDGEGIIEAQFNDLLRDYLLDLRRNFTQAQITELLKLKSASSYRIYWLLREYAMQGKTSRLVPLATLKAILGLEQEYDRFNNFRARVLERARQELAETDLPFSYEALKQGREVTELRFTFGAVPEDSPAALPPAPPAEWEAAVLAAGVSASSLPQVAARLAAGDYDLGYVRYVLATVQAQAAAGKIKNTAGAVFKALTTAYLLPAYHQQARPPARNPKRSAGPALARQKLLAELADARTSLKFAQTAEIYTDATRPAVLAEIAARIAALELKLC